MSNVKSDHPLPTIAILDDYHSRAHRYADWQHQQFASVEFFSKPFTNEDELIAKLQHVKAVGLMRERTPFTASVIQRLPNLELIVTSGKKNASIDSAAAAAQGITVCGTESPGHATAELAFLMIMALSRQLVPLSNALQQHNQWQPVMGKDIRGQTLGILGLGRLGAQLARFAQAMGMKVIAWSENLDQAHCKTLNVNYVSRAEIVDLEALKYALDNNIIAGAAIDVFDKEPTPDNHWIVKHPKVLATPHVGYCTDETFTIFYEQMLEAFKAYYTDKPIRVIASP